MIHVAILGAGDPQAGEIMRILVNHPDVELEALVEPSLSGQAVADVHHGLTGELDMRFAKTTQRADVVFVCRNDGNSLRLLLESLEKKPRIIDLSDSAVAAYPASGAIPAVSEIYRKVLVRGATECFVPRAPETLLLTALFPIARNLLLSGPVEAELIAAPAPGLIPDLVHSTEIAAYLLQQIQQSYNKSVTFLPRTDSAAWRGIRLRLSIPVDMELSDIRGLYEAVYDDHNFTFLTSRPMALKEVEGTAKVLISLTMPRKGILDIDAVADGRLTGGAGDAVHAMNLLFGLHERTGLTLKASEF